MTATSLPAPRHSQHRRGRARCQTGAGSKDLALFLEPDTEGPELVQDGIVDLRQDRDLDAGRADPAFEDEPGADRRGQPDRPRHRGIAARDPEADERRDDPLAPAGLRPDEEFGPEADDVPLPRRV